MNLRIFYHDHCFDGACSASLFTRFHRECIGSITDFSYQGLVHKANGVMRDEEFTGTENAIVDFKYTASSKLTWWFDHHQSAFLTPADQQHFESGQLDGSQKMRQFFDPNYISCTGFIAHVASTNFGMDIAPLREPHLLGQHRRRRKVRECHGGCGARRARDEADPHHRKLA